MLVLYFALAALLALAGRRHWPGRRTLVLTHALVDAGAIALLMYASGGVSSNLGILMVIPVGSMALLAVGREALVIAAIASLAILAQQIASQLQGYSGTGDYLLAGVMGAIVFLVAASAWPVANRLRESEAQVRRQEVDLANMAQLSQYIVQRLRESILVVDPTDRIRLINESAAEMLGDAAAVPGALLGEVSPRLLYLLTTWRSTAEPQPGEAPQGTFTAADGARIVEAHFAPLGAAEPAPVLIFLEDTSALAARVQQSKLAALGRLTASIAHEIRNPVGAMSHAAQLLGESSGLGPARAAHDRDHAQQRAACQRDRRQRAAPVAPRGAAPGAHRAARMVRALPRGILRHHAVRSGALPAAGPLPASWRRSSIRASCSRSCGTCARTPSGTAAPAHAERRMSCWRASPATGASASKSPTAAPESPPPTSNASSSPSSRAARRAPDSGCSWRASWPRSTARRCCMSRARAAAACFAWCSPTPHAGRRCCCPAHRYSDIPARAGLKLSA